jgi:hypothetical protein
MTNKQAMIEKRADISKLVVHLTRDDSATFPRGADAESNFLSILADQEVTAHRAHSLYAKQVPKEHEEKFFVSCFTETPLPQLNKLARPINGREIQLEPWGFAFDREFMFDHGAQQVCYVNSYPEDDPTRAGYNAIFREAKRKGFIGEEWKVLPFVSANQASYDFGWEREIRVRGSLQFDLDDIVCAIVPANVSMSIRQQLARIAVPFFTPGWGLDRFVIESRRQLRRTRRLAATPAPKIAKPQN